MRHSFNMAQKYLTAFDYVDLHANLILQKHARVSKLKPHRIILSLLARKPVFEVSIQVHHKPAVQP